MKAMPVWPGVFEVGGQHYLISDSRLFVHEAFLKEEESERNQKEPKRSQKGVKKGAERKLDILQKLEENPEITQIKLMEEFDLSRKQIQKIIKELRRKGVIIYNHQHKI